MEEKPYRVFSQTVDGLKLKLVDGRLVFKNSCFSIKRYFSLDTSLLVKNREYGYPSTFERFYFKAWFKQIFVFDLFSRTTK